MCDELTPKTEPHSWHIAVSLQDALRAERVASARMARQAQDAAEQAAAATAQAPAGRWAWVGNRLVHTPAAGGAAHPAMPSVAGNMPPPGLQARPGHQAPAGQHYNEQSGAAGPGASEDGGQGHGNGYEAVDGAEAHRGVRRKRRGGRRARTRRNNRDGSGDGDDDDDEGSPYWDDGSSVHASEEFSEPGSAIAELADDYTGSGFGAAPLRRASASGDAGERAAAQRLAAQLGASRLSTPGTTGAMLQGKANPGRLQPPGAADDDDVLGQLLGDLGVSENDRQQAQPHQRGSAQSPHQPIRAADSQPSNADAAHVRQQHVSHAAAPEAAARSQPSAGWKAMLGISTAPTAAAQPKPPEDSFVFSVGFPRAAAAGAAPPAFRPPRPVMTSAPQPGNAAPSHRPVQHQPAREGSSAAPQRARVEPRVEQPPATGAQPPPAGRAADGGSGRRRPAVPRVDTLLLCPITQVDSIACCCTADASPAQPS